LAELRRYRRRPDATVTAVRLDLDTDGFSYRKWGAAQRCKAGDWIVNNAGDAYTVDAESFAKTYRAVGPGLYLKIGDVYAERAESPGVMTTKEGSTAYEAGDMLVFNDRARSDGYAMSAQTFDSLYELCDR